MRYLIALATFWLLTACSGANYTWQNTEGKNPAALEQDRAYCRELARDQGWRLRPSYPRYYGYPYRTDRSGRLFYYDGFRSNRFFSLAEFERDLTNFCLRSRGWELKPLGQP